MSRPILVALRWLLLAGLAMLAAALVADHVARHRARAALAAATLTDARLRAALFDSEVARFRLVPAALRDDREVVATLAGKPGARDALDRKLETLARDMGASVIYLVGPDGIAMAASNWQTRQSFVGVDYRFRRYVRDARRLGAATQFARGTISGRPGLYLARATPDGGIIVVKLEFDALEAAWRRAGGETYIRDAAGVVMVTSEPGWRFDSSRPLSPERLAQLRTEASLSARALRPLPAPARADVERTVATAQPGWTLTLRRSDAQGIGGIARGASLGAALAVAVIFALGWGLRQRAALTRRRTEELEDAVATRTAELTREMERRAEGEARAAELREGLRQANRLATLGQVTASVAHETAQPVAAIRTYADTSATLLRQGDLAAVEGNLATIARLSDRIGAVTAQLRGFARRRAGEVRAIALADVVDGALLILKEQLRPITLDMAAIDPALMVRGGRVRLEQVLVNIVQNAIEALAGRADARVAIRADVAGETVILSVADNGPGIAADIAARIFTPFVTSRANGLGLGLVIAHDIMTELGGTLRLADTSEGARFEIVMARA